MRSEVWMARQRRKADGGLKTIANWIGDDKTHFVDHTFGLAHTIAGSVLGHLKIRFPEYSGREVYPRLAKYGLKKGGASKTQCQALK